ncbi:ECF-type sigma factor [Lysobacter sp. yr284]|uniref:ECF-type sigma factor n=1 Tax=Lysobacter sp. yr284 TaxID=1761791 RepID=UPI0011145C9B|nr:ECF-type sigma factor [Lysobacter sp. yr284]
MVVSAAAETLIPAAQWEDAGFRARFEALYAQLQSIARRELRGAARGTLDTGVLVHEAYLKLNGVELDVSQRGPFLALAAKAMRPRAPAGVGAIHHQCARTALLPDHERSVSGPARDRERDGHSSWAAGDPVHSPRQCSDRPARLGLGTQRSRARIPIRVRSTRGDLADLSRMFCRLQKPVESELIELGVHCFGRWRSR